MTGFLSEAVVNDDDSIESYVNSFDTFDEFFLHRLFDVLHKGRSLRRNKYNVLAPSRERIYDVRTLK